LTSLPERGYRDQVEQRKVVTRLMIEAPELRAIAHELSVDSEEVDRILEQGATLPAVFYVDARIAKLEDELIWRRSWQIVAVEPELKRPGDFLTTHLAGSDFDVPVVVVRDEQLQLRAYINVCRHRAHYVAVGSGNRKTLQCIYHGWTYGLNGCLRNVPRSEEGLPGGVPFEELGLYPLPVDTWAGYVFVALEPTESLTDALGEFPQVLEEVGFEFPFAPENVDPAHDYVRDSGGLYAGGSSGRQQYTEANWKAMIENDIECYHCPTTHTHSFSDMYKVDNKNYTFHNYDRGVYHTSYYQDLIANRLQLEADGKPDYQFYYLWPNMYLEGGKRTRTRAGFFRRCPDGVNAVYGEGAFYRLPGADSLNQDPEVESEFAEKWRLTAEEDSAVAARVQTGLRSGLYKWGYTLPTSERNMRHFYGLVWSTLSPAFR
jgi:phenylpropionate dioxygenase-like ring-hydroxylating dioxygenase large terminal subunit